MSTLQFPCRYQSCDCRGPGYIICRKTDHAILHYMHSNKNFKQRPKNWTPLSPYFISAWTVVPKSMVSFHPSPHRQASSSTSQKKKMLAMLGGSNDQMAVLLLLLCWKIILSSSWKSHNCTNGIQDIVGPVSLSNMSSECKHKLHNTIHTVSNIWISD